MKSAVPVCKTCRFSAQNTSFCEILQNCVIFDNGCYDAIYKKEWRAKNAIYVRHGQPPVFGESNGHGFPVALGVIRDVEAPTYDEAVSEQIAEVSAKKKYHNFSELLETNDIWEVR